MKVYPNKYGHNCSLQESKTKPGTYYFDVEILKLLIDSKGYDSGSVRIDPTYGVQISLGKMPPKEERGGQP